MDLHSGDDLNKVERRIFEAFGAEDEQSAGYCIIFSDVETPQVIDVLNVLGENQAVSLIFARSRD